MTDWRRPADADEGINLVRTNLAAARLDPRDCPTARSNALRPLLLPPAGRPQLPEKYQDFTLKVLMDGLDLIEHHRRGPEEVIEELRHTHGTFGLYGRRVAHPLLLEWSVEAVRRYVAARAEDQRARQVAGQPATLPVKDDWRAGTDPGQVDAQGVGAYELTAWGRRYAALDGSARDLWLLSFGAAKDDRPEAEKAVAAFVAAKGRPAQPNPEDTSRDKWLKPFVPVAPDTLHPGRVTPPERVRVIEFGCGDGVHRELLDWHRDAAQQHFSGKGWPALREAIDGTGIQTGSSCVDCKALSGCAGLPRTPGLLGIVPPPRRRARRSVSVSDLRAYRDCPAKYHATRQLKLRSPRPESPEVRRGRVVDSVLNDRHDVTPHQSCDLLSGPQDPSSWGADGIELAGKEALDGAAMLEQHGTVCPLDGLGPEEEVRVQYQVTCYDAELDLILISTPDLLHTRRGGWIWRETKTAGKHLYEGRPLMAEYPQLALGVLMLAGGALGGDLTRSRVELELLHTDDATFEELDPSRPRVVNEAREIIAALAQPWAQDQLYPATPGWACTGCEALDWCRPGAEHLAARRTDSR